MVNLRELSRQKFKEWLTSSEDDYRSDDDFSLSSQEIKEDDDLPNYLSHLKRIYQAYLANKQRPSSVQEIEQALMDNFKTPDHRIFERNINDNDKNIFHYLNYINFDSAMIEFFENLCNLIQKFNLGNKPFLHQFGRADNEGLIPQDDKPPLKMMPLEHALFKDNIKYAWLLTEQMLSDYSIESIKLVLNASSRKEIISIYPTYIENCKQLNYLVLCYLLKNFLKYKIEDRDKVIDCICFNINNNFISNKDFSKYITLVDRKDRREYSLPLLHRIVLLANTDYLRTKSILDKVSPEKLIELNNDIIDKNGDTALLVLAFFVKNKQAAEIFRILFRFCDPKETNDHGNIFHKLFRNNNQIIIPEVLDIFFSSLTPGVWAKLLLEEAKGGGYIPLAEWILGRPKTPLKSNPSSMNPPYSNLSRTRSGENLSPNYTVMVEAIRRIIEICPEICTANLGPSNDSLLMQAIKNEPLREIIADIILLSNLEHKNKDGQSVEDIAKEYNIELASYAHKAHEDKEKQQRYYVSKSEYEKVCKEHEKQKSDADYYFHEYKRYRDDLSKLQEVSERDIGELKRKSEQLAKDNEQKEKDLKRIRDERSKLQTEKKDLELQIDGDKQLLSDKDEYAKRLNQELVNLNRNLKRAEEENSKLRIELNQYKTKYSEIENKYNETVSENNILINKVEDLNTQLIESNKNIQIIDQLKKELEQAHAKINEEQSEKLQFINCLEKLQTQHEQLQEENQALKDFQSDNEKKDGVYQQLYKRSQEELEQLRDELNEEKNKRQKLEYENKQLTEQNEQLQLANNKLHEEKKCIEQERNEYKELYEEQKPVNEKLTKELEENKKQTKAATEESLRVRQALEAQKEENAILQKQIEGHDAEKQELQTQLNNIKSELQEEKENSKYINGRLELLDKQYQEVLKFLKNNNGSQLATSTEDLSNQHEAVSGSSSVESQSFSVLISNTNSPVFSENLKKRKSIENSEQNKTQEAHDDPSAKKKVKPKKSSAPVEDMDRDGAAPDNLHVNANSSGTPIANNSENQSTNNENKLSIQNMVGTNIDPNINENTDLQLNDQEFYEAVKKLENLKGKIRYAKNENISMPSDNTKKQRKAKPKNYEIKGRAKIKSSEDFKKAELDESVRGKIKYWSENFVFYQLMEHYTVTYNLQDGDIHDLKQGFYFNAIEGPQREGKERKKNIKLEVTWPNKELKDPTSDTAVPVDIQITKSFELNSQQYNQIRFADVKATKLAEFEGSSIHLSKKQIDYAKNTNFSIFRVYNTGNINKAFFRKIKIPQEQAQQTWGGMDLEGVILKDKPFIRK